MQVVMTTTALLMQKNVAHDCEPGPTPAGIVAMASSFCPWRTSQINPAESFPESPEPVLEFFPMQNFRRPKPTDSSCSKAKPLYSPGQRAFLNFDPVGNLNVEEEGPKLKKPRAMQAVSSPGPWHRKSWCQPNSCEIAFAFFFKAIKA